MAFFAGSRITDSSTQDFVRGIVVCGCGLLCKVIVLMLVGLHCVPLAVCGDGGSSAKQVWFLGPLHMMLESCVIDQFWVYCWCVLLMVGVLSASTCG